VTRNGILISGLAALLGLSILCTRHHYSAPLDAISASAFQSPATAANQSPLISTGAAAAPPLVAKPVDIASAKIADPLPEKGAVRQLRVAKAKQSLSRRAAPVVRTPRKLQVSASVRRAYACDQKQQVNLIGSICFDFDSAQLSAASKAKLYKLVPTLKEGKKRIELGGYADSRGKQSYNTTLSQLRANAVLNYLSSQGVDPSSFVTKPYGAQAGKQFQQQRRVDLKVMQV
jgi:outer membrane protein OmpA-like peptidoglycan-associated protein